MGQPRASGTPTWQEHKERARTRGRPPLSLDAPVSALPRVTAADVRLLRKLRVSTVRDLLLNLPVGWESEVTPVADLAVNEQGSVLVTILRIALKRTPRRNMHVTEALVVDDDGARLRAVWFNQQFVAKTLHAGDRAVLSGTVRASRYGGLDLQVKRYERVGDETGGRWEGGLMPKYRLTAGLTARRVKAWVEAALPLAVDLEDEIPEPVRRRHGLLSLAEAVRLGHQPESDEDWARARRRMLFAEVLELQAAFLVARSRMAAERATPVPYRQEVIDAFKAGLGFELTRAQRRATWEVYQDMARPVPMSRLLNGDVGSGKTAVAAAAAAMAHAAGLQ